MRKNAYGIFWACLSFLLVESAYAAADPAPTGTAAAGYEPLVEIPGVPEGPVDISKYLLGIYDFLLSIVGIVAVVMLIWGGMQYIAAAGNGGAVTTAKESIKDALFGLLLALLSYVIVGTINPDVLYLRQPGAAFENQITAGGLGTFTTLADGNILYTSPEGYQRTMSPESAAQVASGETPFVATAGEKVEAMKRNLSCIAPGSPKGNTDPSYAYTNRCTCVEGTKIILPEGVTNCSVACENADKCGYKFLSVKINARHGYTQPDGSVQDGAPAGGAVTNNTGALPEYDLTADPQVHADELYELFGTNDPKWGDFNIVYDTTETTQSVNGPDIVTQLDQPKKYVETGTEIYPCALLVTNEKEMDVDDHFIYWVPLGTTVGEDTSLFEDIRQSYRGGCGTGYFGIERGRCDQAWTDRVMLAKYSYNIIDKCDQCFLADDGSLGKAYSFKDKLTCRSGYWQ